MILFLIKSAACMAIFLTFYKLLLEKESMHTFKRFYLLGALFISFIIPSIVFTEVVATTPINVPIETKNIEFIEDVQITQLIVTDSKFNWELALWSVYGIGVLGFGFRFFRHLFQIGLRIRKNPKLKTNFCVKVLLQEQLPPHTFFSYIFLNRKKYEAKIIPNEVLLHEETHAKQKHSIDVLLIEFLQVIFWFNPLTYLFKKSIKLNHEFLADSAIIINSKDPIQYQNTLLSYLSHDTFNHHQSTGIANAINYSSIKKRFKIMKKETSKKGIVLRSTLLLPLLAILLFGFSETKTIVEKENAASSVNMTYLEINPEIEKYNTLAKKYNAIPIEKRVIPLKDLKILETIYRNMSPGQKEAAQPFPECMPKPNQDGIIKLIHVNINKKGQLLIQDDVVVLEDLQVYLSKINSQLSTNERNKIVKSIIQVDPDTPKDIIKKVEQKINEYGVATIDIVEYNYSLRKTTKTATSAQMAQYNQLAKKYNEMMGKDGNIRILKSDVDQLSYIYGIMSEKQKSSAQPFPEFPEPPPPPKAPKDLKGEKSDIPPPSIPKEPKTNVESTLNFPAPPRSPNAPKTLNTSNFADNQLKEILKNQDPYDHNNLDLKAVDGIPVSSNTFYSRSENENIDLKAQENMRVYIHNTSSSKQANSPSLLENLHSLEKQDAQFYFDGKKITSEEGFQIIKNEKNIKIETLPYSNKQPEVRIYKEKNDFRIPPPPAPPTPPSPLDYIIDAAKKGATFMYEGEKVSSDKAIDLLKNNKELNIESRNKNGMQIVRITKEPVTIE